MRRDRQNDDRATLLEQLPGPHDRQPLLEAGQHLIPVELRRIRNMAVQIVAAPIVAELADHRRQHAPLLIDDEAMPEIGSLREPRRHGLLHGKAGLGEPASGGAHRRADLRRLVSERRRRDRNADRTLEWRALQRHRQPCAVARVRLRHRGEACAQIGDRARERPLHRHHLRRDRTIGSRRWIERGNSSRRRTQAGDAAGIGGIADRAAEIIAVCDRAHAGSDGRCGATAGAARRQPPAPGIVGRAVQIVVGEPAVRERRRVGAPDNHGTRFAETRDHRAVVGRDDVAEGDDAVGGGVAALIDIDLDCDRHAVQHAELRAGFHRFIRRIRRSQRFIGEHLDDGVQRRIDLRDPVEAGLHSFPARDHMRRDRARQIDGRPAPQFILAPRDHCCFLQRVMQQSADAVQSSRNGW
ncbi:hypothetical protein ACVWY2_004142 [Bradyrhizobium sp. JR6.1]